MKFQKIWHKDSLQGQREEGLTELLSLVQLNEKKLAENWQMSRYYKTQQKIHIFFSNMGQQMKLKVEKLPISQISAKLKSLAIWIFCLINLNQIWINNFFQNHQHFILIKWNLVFVYLFNRTLRSYNAFVWFLSSLNKYLLSTYYVLGTGDGAVNQTDKYLPSQTLRSRVELVR